MFKFFRRHRTVVFVFLALCIVGVIFFGIGSTSMLPNANDVVMKVNGRKVRQGEFDRLYNQLAKQKGASTKEQKLALQKEVIDELIRREVFAQEAERYGLRVSDQELQMQIAAIPSFQKDGQFDPQTYAQAIYQVFSTTPKEFEKIHRRDLEARKLNELIVSGVHVTDEEFKKEYAQKLATEKDKEVLKKLKENPESYRSEMRTKEANVVFRDWLNQLNGNLKVSITSESFRKRLESGA